MRVYHFLSATHALDDVTDRRLKIATFDDLNDPFELWAAAQRDPQLRQGLRRFKAKMTSKFGILCFSRDWHNPVLWSHYADRHRGIVLGFDTALGKNVTYVTARPALKGIDEATVQTLLYTKYRDWAYEKECRVFTRLEDRDPKTGLYFADFSKDLILREVITGPLCTTTRDTIEAALRDDHVTITRGRLAFNTFRVVTARQGFRATARKKR